MGKIELGGRQWAVSGALDRLCVSGDRVLIADFKTGRAVPKTVEEVPPNYVAQLAIYRALLQPIYPRQEIRAALVFTEAPALIDIPSVALDQALTRITAP